jgi:hypothetical protein
LIDDEVSAQRMTHVLGAKIYGMKKFDKFALFAERTSTS